jgi:hypothetical protein
VEGLKCFVRNKGIENNSAIITCDFENTNVQGDVVLFEFSLHKMDNPCNELRKALEYVSMS